MIMNRKIVSALIITLFLFSMTTIIKPSYASPSDIHVYPGGSIQTAINSASPWDTIIVHEGNYNENVDVNKTVNLLAEGIVTVNALNPSDHVFYVTASYVNISGFIVTGAKSAIGIYLDNVEHCNISNNNASNNMFGIFLEYSDYNALINNTANLNSGGILLDSSDYNTLINNTVNSNDWGLYLSYSNNTILDSNTANLNGIGIFLSYYSNNNTLADNMVYGNDYGIQIGESS
ncbi:MAG: right-handed parallel beta-helix repeat-containing protein, partial [archaeon]|nr:right-handed parallel beta-helix repeat-containing protein [archaeon]